MSSGQGTHVIKTIGELTTRLKMLKEEAVITGPAVITYLGRGRFKIAADKEVRITKRLTQGSQKR